jgi:hypothetical protein
VFTGGMPWWDWRFGVYFDVWGGGAGFGLIGILAVIAAAVLLVTGATRGLP